MDLRSLYEQAIAAHRAGNLALAEQMYRQMLRADGRNFSALHMLGFLEGQLGRYDEAVTLIGAALKANPTDLAALTNYAHALMAAQRNGEALAAYDRVLAINPNSVETLYNRGVILAGLKQPIEALTAFDRALALQPDAAATLYSRGVVLADMGRHQEALANYDRALTLQPDLAMAAGNRAMSALNLSDWNRTSEIGGQIIAMAARGIPVPPLTLLGYSDNKQLLLQCAQTTVHALVPVRPAPLWRGERYRHDRLRVAYVSSDFREHAVAFQIASLIETHDRARFEIIGVSTGADDNSAVRARLAKAFDQFVDARALNGEQIAQRLRQMEVDIAIDLNGHTGGARLELFAWRPAPVQATWLGFPGTNGADFIDYLIADRIVAPVADQRFFSEKIVYLPDNFFQTDRDREATEPPSRSQEDLPDDAFVFCCFNNNWKFTPPVWNGWMRLLTAVPSSVLWLKKTNADAMKNLRREAKARGVDSTRLIFADDAPRDMHLARHALADLFLDTLPYNAHATAADALWAGLPVLTCQGASFAGRVGASLLHAAGLPELVTATMDAYEALALRLAREPDTLKSLRARLAQNRLAMPLFDTARLRTGLETALIAMLEERLQRISLGE